MTAANTFGTFFQAHSFGESHGGALGVVIDGIPAGVRIDEDLLKKNLARRRPGQSALVSARAEEDRPEILSGVYEGQSLGTPIAVIVRNQDARSQDYEKIAREARPGHADDVWQSKYLHRDPRGGGRSSGRETLSRVIAGAFAEMLVKQLFPRCAVLGFADQIGELELSAEDNARAFRLGTDEIDRFAARFPSERLSPSLQALLTEAKLHGKSYGGGARLLIRGVPANLGRPVFHKLKADFAAAAMGLGATCAFEVGEGLASTTVEGSQFHRQGEKPYGGLRGGISTGEDIVLRVAFKPTSSVLDVAKAGRHDPCIVPRAIPVLEAMLWLCLADHLLARRLDTLEGV